MSANAPDDEGERGAIVMTASIAAYDGQISPPTRPPRVEWSP